MPLNRGSNRSLFRSRKPEIKETAPPEKSSLLTTLVVPATLAILALLGTIAGSLINGYRDTELARQKYQSDLVLKALESGAPKERLQSLQMLTGTNLLKDSEVRDAVNNYIKEQEDKEKNKQPLTIPQIKSSAVQTLEPPIIENARMYLLTGKKNDDAALADLKKELTAANYPILGAKSLVDPGRPPEPEVRYFNDVDKPQAEKIAEFMRLKFPAIPAQKYEDSSAKPGYIEIWLGR